MGEEHQNRKEHLKSRDTKTRYQAVEELGNTKNKETADLLLSALKDENVFVRARAVDLLLTFFGQPQDTGIGEWLIRALDDESALIRAGCAEVLGRAGYKRAAEMLIKCLDDRHFRVRAEAAYSLGRIEEQSAVIPLISSLEQEENQLARSAIAYALGRIKDERAVSPLIRALYKGSEGYLYSSPTVYIVEALQHLGGRRAAAAIKKAKDMELDVTQSTLQSQIEYSLNVFKDES